MFSIEKILFIKYYSYYTCNLTAVIDCILIKLIEKKVTK